MLKASLLICVAVLLLAVCVPMLAGGPQQGTPAPALAPAPAATLPQAAETKNPVKPTAESQANAKSLYQRDCALCHADNGSGKSDLASSMNLTLEDWANPASLISKSDASLFAAIRSGKGDKMPAEDAGRAKDAEVWNLVIYIRKFGKNQPAPAAAPATPPAAPSDAPPAPPTGLTGTTQ